MNTMLYLLKTNHQRMRRCLLGVLSLLLLTLGSFKASAQTVPIPDPNFRQFLASTFPEVIDANQELILAEAAKVEDTFVCENLQIKSLEGIQYFTGIHRLYCEHNELTALPDLSGLTNLLDLRFAHNKFTVFPNMATISPKLQTLACRDNQLTSIPDLSGHKTLITLDFGENQLTRLPDLSSLTQLYTLSCDHNQLTQLPDLSKNTELVGIGFDNNQFTSFPDISANTKMSYIRCGHNQLTSLPDFSKYPSLGELMCGNNLLTALPDFSKNSFLGFLECRNNQLTALPDLSANTRLHTLLSDNNQLTVLPPFPTNALRILSVDSNQLTALPDFLDNMNLVSLSCMNNNLTALPDLSNHTKLAVLEFSNNHIATVPDLSKTSLCWLKAQNNRLTSLPKLPAASSWMVFFVEGNQMTFEDILPVLPLKVAPQGLSTTFGPQAKIGTQETVTLKPGASYTIQLNIDNTLTNNVYQWYKTVDEGTFPVATTDQNSLTLSNVSLKDAGVYTCVVTNPGVAAEALTLESHLVTIQIDEPWIPVISGGENHLIVIPANTPTTINGTPIAVGDFIGIFFTGSNGELVNGGMVKWTGEHLTLNAWGSNRLPKNGFAANEAFTIKVWRAAERKEYTVNATYSTTAPHTHAGSFAANGFTGIKSLGTPPVCVQQTIALHSGWNLISMNVQPDNLAMSAIFAGIADVLVKDAAGQIKYAPQQGITTGVWNVLEGYKVLVTSDQPLTVCGKAIDPLTTLAIPHTPYPYFLPYFASLPMPVSNALKGLGTNFSFAQSNEYRNNADVLNAYNYLPAHVIDPSINKIGLMRPGLAYKVSMTGAVAASRYPAITATPQNEGGRIEGLSLAHYQLSQSTTGNNALLVVPKASIGTQLIVGDEIGVFSTDGSLAGAGQYDGENLVITVWETERMKAGATYQVKVWKQESGEEIVADVTYLKGNGQYASNSVQVLQTARLTSSAETVAETQLISYPNPANQTVRFKLSGLSTTGPVSVAVHDMMGTQLTEISQPSLAQVQLPVHALVAGQYVCVLKVNGREYRSKLVVIK